MKYNRINMEKVKNKSMEDKTYLTGKDEEDGRMDEKHSLIFQK